VLGVGLGVLMRSQIATVITGSVAYIVGGQAIYVAFGLIRGFWIKHDWVMKLMVVWPSVASQVMVSPDRVNDYTPPWWVGALILVGYGLVFGTIGTLITRKRDIS
jgi:hypothetical protein